MINNEYDSSFRSVKFLYERATKVLFDNYSLSNFFCPDLGEVDFQKLNLDDTVEVILFGSFFRSLMESGNWPFSKFRLWVISSCVKSFIVKELNVDESSISVIPRESILLTKSSKQIDWNKSLTFVYAGRLNEAKNIEAIIALVNVLQNEYRKDIGLNLIGEVDNQEKIYVEYKKSSNYQEKLLSFIDSFNWTKRPELIDFLPQDKWVQQEIDNPVFISLSTNFFEDYGVSAQQALKKGWPVILSAWGGHLDVIQEHISIPSSMLTQFKESKLRARQVANYLLSDNVELYSAGPLSLEIPRVSTASDFAEKRLSKIVSYNQACFCAMRTEWNELFFSKEGIQLINRYREAFTKKEAVCHDVLIVSDYYNSSEEFEDVSAFIEEAFSAALKENKGILIYSYIELCSKEVWGNIMQSQRVYLGIRDVKEKLSSSYDKLSQLFDDKDIVVLDV